MRRHNHDDAAVLAAALHLAPPATPDEARAALAALARSIAAGTHGDETPVRFGAERALVALDAILGDPPGTARARIGGRVSWASIARDVTTPGEEW